MMKMNAKDLVSRASQFDVVLAPGGQGRETIPLKEFAKAIELLKETKDDETPKSNLSHHEVEIFENETDRLLSRQLMEIDPKRTVFLDGNGMIVRGIGCRIELRDTKNKWLFDFNFVANVLLFSSTVRINLNISLTEEDTPGKARLSTALRKRFGFLEDTRIAYSDDKNATVHQPSQEEFSEFFDSTIMAEVDTTKSLWHGFRIQLSNKKDEWLFRYSKGTLEYSSKRINKIVRKHFGDISNVNKLMKISATAHFTGWDITTVLAG
jgi:hypothetical protein